MSSLTLLSVSIANAQNVDGDVISLTAGLAVTRDSNLLRLPDGSDTRRFGGDTRGDTFLRGNLGISFDRLISRQRLQANAEIEAFKYREYNDFDNVGYNAGVNYDWVIGRPFFGQIGARIFKFQPTVQDRTFNRPDAPRNDVERQTLYLKGGVKVTPSWSVIAGWDLDRRRNTSFLYEDADADLNTAEVGMRYAPGTGAEIDLVYRRTKGDYRLDQQFGSDGTPLLIAGRSNDFSQDAVLARIQYKPSEDSRLAGRIGFTNRKYDVDSGRDFSGLTTGFDIEWALSGAIQMRVAVSRDIEPDESAIVATYADAKSIRVAPVIQATGKIQLIPFAQYIDRSYTGEGGGFRRKDRFTAIGLGANYEIRRNLNAILDLRREERNSNVDVLDYTANIVSIGIQARF